MPSGHGTIKARSKRTSSPTTRNTTTSNTTSADSGDCGLPSSLAHSWRALLLLPYPLQCLHSQSSRGLGLGCSPSTGRALVMGPVSALAFALCLLQLSTASVAAAPNRPRQERAVHCALASGREAWPHFLPLRSSTLVFSHLQASFRAHCRRRALRRKQDVTRLRLAGRHFVSAQWR